MSYTNTNTNTSNNTISTTAAAATSRAGHGGDTTSPWACAACRFQRRKCPPDCIIAPHFPPHQQRQFLNAHRLFGVSNIVKVLKNVKTWERETAMKSLIFDANMRAHDPVGGCHRIIRDLERQIYKNRVELEITLHQLAICRPNPNPSLVNPLLVSNPVPLQTTDSDFYGRSVSANRIQEQEPLYDIDTVSYNSLGTQMNMEGSSSSMLMGTQQVFLNIDTVSYNTLGNQMNMGGSSSSMLMGTQQGFVDIDTVSYNTLGKQMNMEGSSSSMLMGTQQGFVESEDINPTGIGDGFLMLMGTQQGFVESEDINPIRIGDEKESNKSGFV